MLQGRGDYFFILIKRGNENIQFEISDSYDQGLSGFSGDYEYWGYLNTNGGWIIQRHQISTGQYRYCRGTGNFSINWGIRASLTYTTFDALFS